MEDPPSVCVKIFGVPVILTVDPLVTFASLVMSLLYCLSGENALIGLFVYFLGMNCE